MVEFQRYKLENGLTVLLHQDKTTPMAVVNTLYDVGARDENEQKTSVGEIVGYTTSLVSILALIKSF